MQSRFSQNFHDHRGSGNDQYHSTQERYTHSPTNSSLQQLRNLSDSQQVNTGNDPGWSLNSFSRRVHGDPIDVYRMQPSERTFATYQGNSGLQQYRNMERCEFSERADPHNWASKQELKIKVSGLPRGCWTSDVYSTFHEKGNIIKIEMQPSSTEGVAWVIFREAFWHNPVHIGNTRVFVEVYPSRIFTVPSPVNTKKEYKQINIICANAIDFGVRIADTTIMVMRSVEAPGDIQVMLNLQRKEIDIMFPFQVDNETSSYRFRLPISVLDKLYKQTSQTPNLCSLIIPFGSAPQFFRKAKDISATCNPSDRFWSEWCALDRQTDIVDTKTRARLASSPVMDLRDMALIDIGDWTCYRLHFDLRNLRGSQFQEFADALVDHGVFIKEDVDFGRVDPRDDPVLELLQDELSTTHPHLAPPLPRAASDDLFTSFANAISLPFHVRYQLEVCLSNHYLLRYNITRSFLERLESMDAAKAISILEKVADQQIVYYNPMDIFNIRIKGQHSQRVPAYCVLSRAANITPSTMHVATTVVEISNRVVRRYAADSDKLLRVKFSDEKTEGRLSSQGENRADAPFSRVERAMTKGIIICGRYYEFLAYGNSQFRENGAYFYAPTPSVSTDEIRRRMGSFDHIKTVAKWGARQGQCFSTTRTIGMNVTIKEINDITRNGFNFTDGVGKISLLLAQLAAKELGLHNPFDDPPSLYQFRLAGCKGVLALDPDVLGTEVYIRPSQYKFAVESQGLEIIRASAFSTASFNRQLITVLSALGVSNQKFIKKQQEMVNDYERATKDETVALEKLQENIDCNQTSLTMAGMILDGFMNCKEPFLMSLLHLWRAYHMQKLKEKAKIILKDGAFVLGCVDEVGVLRGHYNEPQSRTNATRNEKIATLPEIFIRVSNYEKKGFYKVIEGVCIIARNPSLHPGDIRVVRAVDRPELHHLKNVLVLPQTGDRDIASMCSGGDLDGDDFLVLWDRDFLPESINEIPMDFTPPKPQEQATPVTVSDVAKFFVKYMKNDSLSRIALAHLAQADFNEKGVRDEKCLELAHLHSQAVDYPKSGIPATMDRALKPRRWPHFMESKYRTRDQIYKSRNILGLLYDQVKLVDFKPQYENAFDSRILNAFDVNEVLIQKAAGIKCNYDSAVRRLMAKHAIRTEFEVWSVFVLSHNQEMRNDYTFAEDFGNLVSVLKRQYQQLCREAAGATNLADFAQLAPFVTAMYTVTAREIEQALEECRMTKTVGGQQVPVRKMVPGEMPLMSFPWLFVNELGKIALGIKDRSPALVRQGYARKARKPSISVPEPGMGEVATSEGITHYGELLTLRFESTDGNEIVGTKDSPSPGNESAASSGEKDASEEEEIIVEMGPRKISAMDRLQRLNLT